MIVRGRLIAALVAATMVVAACSSDDDGGAEATTAGPEPTAAAVTTESEATQPEATEPETTEAETTEAETTEPETTEPETTDAEPATTVADTTSPATTGPATCGAVPPGLTETVLTAGGGDHPVRIFVPSSFAGAPLPVVLDWHGLGSDGIQQAGLLGLRDPRRGRGLHRRPPDRPAPRHNSWELGDDQDPARDDLAFVDALLDLLIDDWCADPSGSIRPACRTAGTSRPASCASGPIGSPPRPRSPAPTTRTAAARHVPCRTTPTTAPPTLVVPFDGSGESVLAR